MIVLLPSGHAMQIDDADCAFQRVRYASHGHLTEEAAARAYDALARQHHGEFARVNFP